MRVIAHNGSPTLGGGETGSALLLHELQARGHSVLMLCRDEEMAERVGAFADIPTGVQRIGGGAVLTDAIAFARRMRAEKADAVILTSFKKVFLAGLGARLAKVPRVILRVVLETDSPTRRPQYIFALRRFVDAVVFNADVMRAAFLAAAPKLDPARLVTIYDGVRAPVARQPHGTLRHELGIPLDAPVMGAVARLVSQKRFDRLVDAMARMPDDVHCIIAGEGPQHDRLVAAARDAGVHTRLHLLGFRTDIGDVLDALDLFVVCSDHEGMANAMLEAMAFGIPIVSTPVSGAQESLDALDGTAPGVIVNADAASLAGSIDALLREPVRRRAMGVAAQRRVQQRFTQAAFVDRWERLLSSKLPHE